MMFAILELLPQIKNQLNRDTDIFKQLPMTTSASDNEPNQYLISNHSVKEETLWAV